MQRLSLGGRIPSGKRRRNPIFARDESALTQHEIIAGRAKTDSISDEESAIKAAEFTRYSAKTRCGGLSRPI
jgi:hypothetical protein